MTDNNEVMELTNPLENLDVVVVKKSKPRLRKELHEIKPRVTHDHHCGEKYGRLTLLKLDGYRVGNSSSRSPYFLCKCDCGNTTRVELRSMKSGDTLSCGCIKKEMKMCSRKTHGMTGTPEYNTYGNMLKRCYDVKCDMYKYYGGRGITISEEWLKGFSYFFKDMGLRPSKEYSIERIDNNKGYSKENCKWATNEEQTKNKRPNCTETIFTYDGKTKNMRAWAKYLNVGYSWMKYYVSTKKMDFSDIVIKSKTYKPKKR